MGNIYEELQLSKKAVEFGRKLYEYFQRSDSELLMIPRACGPKLSNWRKYIKDVILDFSNAYNGTNIKMSDYEWFNQKNISMVCEELREKGQIKDFDESLKYINYFIKTFRKETNTIIRADSIEGYWLCIGKNGCLTIHDYSASYNKYYDSRVKGIAASYIEAVKTLMRQILEERQYFVVLDAINGHVLEGSSDEYNAAIKKLKPHALNIVYILAMGIDDNTFRELSQN